MNNSEKDHLARATELAGGVANCSKSPKGSAVGKSLADVYRERGKCQVCGEGERASRHVFDFCRACGRKAHGNNLAKYERNRATPAEKTPESDEQWLKRMVKELTGLGCHVFRAANDGIYCRIGERMASVQIDLTRPAERRSLALLGASLRSFAIETPGADASPEPDCACGHAGCQRCDAGPTVAAVPPDSHCSECGIPCPGGELPMCPEHAERRRIANTFIGIDLADPYKEHAIKLQNHGIGEPNLFFYTHGQPGQAESRARLAALDEAERPRKTKTTKLLERGHPSAWPSNEGEEP